MTIADQLNQLSKGKIVELCDTAHLDRHFIAKIASGHIHPAPWLQRQITEGLEAIGQGSTPQNSATTRPDPHSHTSPPSIATRPSGAVSEGKGRGRQVEKSATGPARPARHEKTLPSKNRPLALGVRSGR